MIGYIPLRDIALFPGAEVTLVFGRPESVEVLRSVGDGLVAFSTQHDFMEESPSADRVFRIGVLASVLKLRQTSPTTYSAVFRIGASVELDPMPESRAARLVREIARPPGQHTPHSIALVDALRAMCSTSMPVPPTPGGAADTLASVLLISRPQDQQALLEEVDPHRRLRRLWVLVGGTG